MSRHAATGIGATCELALVVHRVVAHVEMRNGTTYEQIPFPPGMFYTIDAAAVLFGVSRKTLWNELSEKRALFDPPQYRPDRTGPRRCRKLTEHDMQVLRTIFRMTVKRKLMGTTR